MSKKLNKFFACALVMLLLLTLPLSVALKNASNATIKAQQTLLDDNDEIFNQENQGLVYVTGANVDKDGINQPIYETQSSTYIIKVNLWLSSAFNGESFNVYYRTYDISAIASTGDYEHKQGSVLVSGEITDYKNTPIATIDIPVYPNSVALQYVSKSSSGINDQGVVSQERKARSFVFELVETDSNLWKVASDKKYKEIENMVCAESTIPVTSWEYRQVGDKFYPTNYIFDAYYNVKTTPTTYSLWTDTYNSPNLSGYSYGEVFYTFNESEEEKIYAKFAKEAISVEFNPNGYGNLGYQVKVNDSAAVSIRLEDYGKLCKTTVESCYGEYAYDDRTRIYNVTSEPADTYKVSVICGGDGVVKDIKLYKRWVDLKAPEVVDMYVQDTSTISVNDSRWRVYVRFDEPVHFANESGPVTNKDQLPYLAGTAGFESIQFYYVGGEWTDTLCFEADVSGYQKSTISKLCIEQLLNCENIWDFSYDHYIKGKNAKLDTSRYYGNNACKPIESRYLSITPLFVDTPSVIGEKINKVGNSDFVKSITANLDLDMGVGGSLSYRWTNTPTDSQTDWDEIITDLQDKAVISSGNENGEVYLQVQLTSSYKKKSRIFTYGPYNFDTTSPTIETALSDESNLQQKIFNIQSQDLGSGVKSVYAIKLLQEPYREVFENPTNYEIIEIKNWQNGYTVTASSLGLVGEEDNSCYIGFYAEDNLGHLSYEDISKINYVKIRFDSRTIFKSYLTFAYDSNGINVTKNLVDCQDKTYIIDTSRIASLGFERDKEETLFVSVNKFAKLNNEVWEDIDSQYYSCLEYGQYSWRLNLSKNLTAGLYQVVFEGDFNGEGVDVKTTETYYLYLTNNYQEETSNFKAIQSGTTLLNEVYQLNALSYFYFMDNLGRVQTEYYGNTALSATFSSVEVAKKYTYFYELQDLYAVIISADTASRLNQGTTGYIKSDADEGRMASVGDVWIRYKRASWNNNVEVNYWVYYYYGKTNITPTVDTPTKISVEKISTYLKDCISIVAERIAQNGATNFLIGDGNTDSNGMPYVHVSQIHNQVQSCTTSKNGTTFEQPISYLGDSSVYSSKIELLGTRYDLATNFKFDFSNNTLVWYRYENSNEYIKMSVSTGFSLKDYVKTTGVYYIREASVNGVKEYAVYVDLTAPVVNVIWKDGKTERKTHLVGNQTLSVKQFILELFDESECDKFSYVAVYRYRNSSLGLPTAVYTTARLERESVILEDGKWILQIGDRSGNYYLVTINISALPLVCKVDVTENEHFRIICNRSIEQIDRYEVYKNGSLITLTYSENKKIVDAGNYRIYVSDIYGNVFEHNFTFLRALPSIEWKYDVNGVPYDYTENSKHVKITKSSQNGYTYYIKTSVALRFSFTANYLFEFSGISTDAYSKTNYGARLKEPTSFTLKVWYADFESVYVIYHCTVDTSAPEVFVTYEENYYEFSEIEKLNELAQNSNNGDRLIPDSIYYYKTSSTIRVENNANIFAQTIKLWASDDSGINSVKIYLNGTLQENYIENNNAIILNGFGKYRIEVVDSFENLSVFEFNNDNVDYLKCFADGVEKNVKQENIYGNGNINFTLNENGDAYFIINGKFIAIRVENGNIYELYYKTAEVQEGGEYRKYAVLQRSEHTLFSLSNSDSDVNKEYRLFNKDQFGADVYVSFDSQLKLSIRIENVAERDEITSVIARFYFNDHVEPIYLNMELCKREPTISYIDKQNVQIGKQYDCNDFVEVDSSSIDLNVDKIFVYFALPSKDYNLLSEIYSNGIYSGSKFTQEGLYKIVVIDLYGNQSEYYFALLKSFVVTITATFADGTQATYLDKDIVYSNNYITFEALTDKVVVKVNGVEVETTTDNLGRTVFVLYGDIDCVVTLTDKYGNQIEQAVKILNKSLQLQDDIIVGYPSVLPELKNQGYTNQKLSIVEEKLAINNIYYIEVEFNGEKEILLDKIYNQIELSNLVECIGKKGDGVYKILFRDAYGNKLVKTINYRASSALQITRTIRSSSTEENYSIQKMLIDNTVWSNNIVKLSTIAQNYVLTINGVVEKCPKTLSFNSSANTGSFSYEVTYADEYGFSYTFTIHLLREVIELKPVGVTLTEVEGVLTTKDNILLSYNSGAQCTYTLGDGKVVNYTQGEALKTDGIYKISVMDIAGNIANLTIRKDTLVEYAFVETATNEELVNGGICSTNKVSFEKKEKGEVYLKKVFFNGKLLTNFIEEKFSDTGKWEFIIADEIGNESYFAFYILEKEISTFTYYAPYGYVITDVRVDEGDGVKNQVLDCIYDSGAYMVANKNGIYSIIMVSTITEGVINSSFTVNNTPPKVALVGCNEGEETTNNVTIQGLKEGDTVYIYKDGKLVKTVKMTSMQTDSPVIKDAGYYKVVVENQAGVTTTLTFQREYMPNVATSILIIVVIIIIIIGLMVGLIWRNHSKTDN